MLALFPGERPVYSSAVADNYGQPHAISRLLYGTVYAQSITVIRRGGRVSRGMARVKRAKLAGKLVSDRLLQRIIKQSFYRAASELMDVRPVWGSLTGIRPTRIASAALSEGMSDVSVVRKLTRDYYVATERAGMCVRAAKSSLALSYTLSPDDIALYVGIPFCPTRCAYCSFVSNSVEKSFGLIDPFVQTLLSEIEAAARVVDELGLRIITIYIGGGTPTALPPDALETIMTALKTSFDLSGIREYTVEAGRPDTITSHKLEIVRRLGAGRVCVNPQSMSAEVLEAIGRKHTPEDALEAARIVRESGMALNMDIIAGLPADTPGGFRHTLDTTLTFEPENITVHTLSLKKGSRIMLEGTRTPTGEDVSEMLGYASRRLSGNGYGPYYLYRQKYTSGGYENTGWSLPGHEGVYNICMMEELCTVLALGGGGVTKLVDPGGRIQRIFNAKYPREYIMQEDKQRAKFETIRRSRG